MSFHHPIKLQPTLGAPVQGHCRKMATRWDKKSLDFLWIKTSTQLGTFGASSLVSECIHPTPLTKSTLSANGLPRGFPSYPTDRYGAVGPSDPPCRLSPGDVLQCNGEMSTSHIYKEGKKKTPTLSSVPGVPENEIKSINIDSWLITSQYNNSH